MDDGNRAADYYSCFSRVVSCLVLSVIYIASLYVWNSPHDRDHPDTIKRRFFSVFIVSLISPLFIYYFSSENILHQGSIWQLLGFRTEGLLAASVLPLLLTMVLFLGPLAMMQGHLEQYQSQLDFRSYLCNLIWLRNQIVAPLSEEFTFRACMLPLLLQCLRPSTAIIVSPLFFGIAHFHHMFERVKKGVPFKSSLYISCFQFSYTTIFGAYSAFLFVRTGHLIAPFLTHSFCNRMGFPDFVELSSQPQPRRGVLLGLFVTGLVGWGVLLVPLTQPALYHNQQFWVEPILAAANGTTLPS